MDTHRKKTRQRNRPRNKSYRINEPIVANENSMTDLPTIESNSCKDVQNSKSKELPIKVQGEGQTHVFADNFEAIKVIQQIMRAKLLKNQKNTQNKSEEDQKTRKSTEELTEATKQDVKEKAASENYAETLKKATKADVKENAASENDAEKNAFIENLQKNVESAMANGDGLPNTLFGNLQKLFNQGPISDVETSDDEEEYIEYVYKPRQYFLVSLCNLCKCNLCSKKLLPCSRCKMTYYCSAEHMKSDVNHRQLCFALRQVADSNGNHIFYKCGEFTTEQFRCYRIITIRKVEAAMNRPLTATEQEVILFPRICSSVNCREYRFDKLIDCEHCGQVAFCKQNSDHLSKQHKEWCKSYQLLKELIVFQEKFGRLDPSLPSKILRDIPGACCNTKQILSKLSFDMHDQCEYAALSQISTCPLTAWYALKLCNQLKKCEIVTIHLIGAEIDFEVDTLHKWELFFLHITPSVKQLNVVFIGPELNPGNISFDQLKKIKCCRSCRKTDRTVSYYFKNQFYHKYCGQNNEFLQPDLVCFFNAGLHRSTGYHSEDTWPETILAAASLKCPVVVTSYTKYESPLDMKRFVQESNRLLNVVLPPIINPFASEKPERNFISDEDAPLMFKNYYCFVIE